MKLEINKKSEEPVHVQLREQIIFRISTGELPSGYVMPSVRTLARQHVISPNTVSRAYRELVERKWLVERQGSRHIVVERTKYKPEPEDLDGLITRTIRVAQESGYSLQQLAARLRERLLERPPDHLLIIEPEAEMGELMREEMLRAIGIAPASCFVHALPANPALAIGAVLLIPWPLEGVLRRISSQIPPLVLLEYSQPDPHVARIRELPDSSRVGFVSISPAALRTGSSALAPAIGERHTLYLFHMKWPVGKDGPRFKRYSDDQYPQRPSVLDVEAWGEWLRRGTVSNSDCANEKEDVGSLLSAIDLDFVDILFCDSITYKVVKHRRRIRAQLLSDESLKAVAARSKSLLETVGTVEAERRAAADKLEAER
jgi:DNA-binding transcriptional regulator YhcF (GntR family)